MNKECMIGRFYIKMGKGVAKRRKAAGMTQEDLAKRLYMSRPSIANIEVGRQKILLHVFVRIMEITDEATK